MTLIFRSLRWLFGLAGVALLLCAAVIGSAVWLTLPGGNASVQIPGLSAPVDITVDDDGIPRIKAANERDAAAALGFMHARDRLFQMDLMRRAANGELSEIAGPGTLPIDRLMRTLGVRQHAEADLAQLAPDTRAILDSYAAGVNAWISAHGRLSSLEFAALGPPRPWTATDSLLWGKTMGLYLSGNWRQELARLQLSATMSRAQIESLWPSQEARAEDAMLQPDHAAQLTRLAAVLPNFPDPFTLPSTASNEWAVDGAHSATGRPLLAGDPHLAFGLPGIWYLARIDLPDGERVGATAPGVPFLVIGHNGHIAWTFTTTGADVQDVFVEKPADDGYLTENGPRPFVSRTETIHVRDQPDDILHVRETRHGPVVSDLSDIKEPIIAVEMANLSPGDGAATGLLALNRARSVAEAGQAAAAITSPVQNLLVADSDGIGFFVTGRVPVRRSGDGAFGSRGDDGSQDWVGWAQGADLPHVVAPASGRLVNTNERVAPPDFPVFLGRDWFGDPRTRRIRAMLDASPHPKAADFAGMQADSLDLVAAGLLPQLRQIAPILGDWDGRMTVDRKEPLIFNAWMGEFYRRLLAQLKVPPTAGPAVAPWPDLIPWVLSPSGSSMCGGDCKTLLTESYAAAMTTLTARFGNDSDRWRWGDAHQAVFANPLLSAIPVLGGLAEARIEANGSDSTVNRGGVRAGTMESVHGASYRGVYDLSDLDRSLFMVAPGQSGDPASSLARNFVRPWRDGSTITLSKEPASIAASIRLSP